MKDEKTEKERVRKAYAPRGQRSQGRMTFRIDYENEEWLQSHVTNKGRYLNELIRRDREGATAVVR